MLKPNTYLRHNRYRIIRPIGQGGMGAVYEAFDLSLKTKVAVKEALVYEASLRRAFEKEGQRLARLRHPALPKVIDHFTEQGGQYLVMEFISGQDLAQMLKQRGQPFPVPQVIGWAERLLDALSYLHQKKVIHRDIKPANIKLTPTGELILLDFGLAKGGLTQHTLSGMSLKGYTPGYAPPEQVHGQATDQRSDLYSLAATLYALLTNQAPQEPSVRKEVMAHQVPDPLRPANELNPDVSPQLAHLLTRALALEPDKRFATAAEMRSQLISPPKPPIPAPISEQTTRLTGKGAMGRVPSSTGRLLAQLPTWAIAAGGVIGIIVLLIGIFLGTMFINPPSAEEPTKPPAAEAQPTNTPLPPLEIGLTIISEKDGMTLLYVPEGEFKMGAADDDPDAYNREKPRHTVFLSAYWIDQTEVTNEMFGRFVQETSYQTEAEKEGWGYVCDDGSCDQTDGADWQHPQGPSSNLDGLESHPVVQVSWHDANAYCQWAGRRLPTEGEWEKAARGTDGRIYPWGLETPTGKLANFCDANCAWDWADESVDDGHTLTAPVGSYPAGASPYGALDMTGNVWEWINDWYDEDYYAESPRDNPQGPLALGEYRALRGGSWDSGARWLRGLVRGWDIPSDRLDYQGFRCAKYRLEE